MGEQTRRYLFPGLLVDVVSKDMTGRATERTKDEMEDRIRKKAAPPETNDTS